MEVELGGKKSFALGHEGLIFLHHVVQNFP